MEGGKELSYSTYKKRATFKNINSKNITECQAC